MWKKVSPGIFDLSRETGIKLASVGPVIEVAFAYEDLRVGEIKLAVLIAKSAGVVDVCVGQHHCIDFQGVNACLLHAFQ
ncbi:hypothetical protein D3C87_1451970 [compost metagenome]